MNQEAITGEGKPHDQLAQLRQEIADSIRQEGFVPFCGAFPSEDTPRIPWNETIDPDWRHFLQAAKYLGVNVIYTDWQEFTEEEIEEALIEQEEHSTDEASAWVQGHNQQVEQFRRYVGLTAAVQIGFSANGLFHFYGRTTSWYEHFNELNEGEIPQEFRQKEGVRYETIKPWVDKLANHPRFGGLKTWDQRCYLLRTLAADAYENLPVEEIVRQAETMYEVDIRPEEENRLLEQVKELRNQKRSIVAIAGKLGLPRERVRMLVGKFED